jgi:nucleotide-binding universal stress UspA family protein
MKVIIAIDQTVNWKFLIETVIKRHWPKDTSFRVLTVVPPLEWKDMEDLGSGEILQEIIKLRKKTAENILHEAREQLIQNITDCSVHTELRKGSPRDEILQAAASWMADKIILGAHGHAQNRLLPGAVSRSVALNALCSVELVRLKTTSHPKGQPRHEHVAQV